MFRRCPDQRLEVSCDSLTAGGSLEESTGNQHEERKPSSRRVKPTVHVIPELLFDSISVPESDDFAN
jgi:hypothetical protein